MRSHRILSILVAATIGLGACSEAADDDDSRDAPEVLPSAAAKGDAPGWFAERGILVAGAIEAGDFEGWDSAHLFQYQGVEGQHLTVDLGVALESGRGAALAIWGPDGRLVDWRASSGDSTTLVVAALPADGAYQVGAFTRTWQATGGYELALWVTCGSRGLAACSAGTLCRWEPGQLCGATDLPGTCRPPDAPHDKTCDGPPPDETTRCHASAECGAGTSCVGRPAYLPPELEGTDAARGCCIDTATLAGQGNLCAGDADCGEGLVCIGDQCSPAWMMTELVSSPNAVIPDDDPAGLSDTVIAACLASVPVTVHADVFISHSWVGDLEVTITDPSGDVTTTLWERAGGSADDLELLDVLVSHTGDDAVNGPWTLKVVDTAGWDVGVLAEWRLRLTSRWD